MTSLADIGVLVEELERLPDAQAQAREKARALVRAVLDLHRAGLERALHLLGQQPAGAALIDSLARDAQVAMLLSLHGLHPRDIHTRAQATIDELRPRLLELGIALDLTSLSDDSAHLSARKAGPLRANPAAIRAEIERAFLRDVPEISTLIIAGLDADADADTDLLPASRLTRQPR